MYSVILMAAMTTAPETPAFGKKFGGHGCWAACHGCAGCFGGCHGCHGFSGFSCHGSLMNHHACHGCYGGCYGSAFGVYGGYIGCHGCYGGSACYGGAYGGCYGACFGGCHGCYGTSNYFLDNAGFMTPAHAWGQVVPGAPATMPGNNPMTAPAAKPDPAGDKPAAGGANPGAYRTAPARLTIDAPADARVFVDDAPYQIDGSRQFQTPPLKAGQTYFYTVRIETERDGRPVRETRRVLVKAGDDLREAFLGVKPTDPVVTVKAE